MITELFILGSVLHTGHNIKEYERNKERASRITDQAFFEWNNSQDKLREQCFSTEASLEKLFNRRQSIFNTTIPFFVDVMSPLKKANCLELSEIALVEQMQKRIVSFSKISTEIHMSQAKAPYNPDFLTYFLFGISGYTNQMKKQSEFSISQAEIVSKGAKAYTIQCEVTIEYLKYLEMQCDIMAGLSMRFNMILIQLLQAFKKIVDQKGEEKKLYSLEDRKLMRSCFRFLEAINILTDANLLDGDEVSESFLKAIEYGQNQLANINQLIGAQYNNIINYK